MKNKLIILLALTAAACAGKTPPPEPIIRTVEVIVPGPTQPCVPKTLAGPPAYADETSALRKAVDAAARYALLWAGREQRIAREKELETVVNGCPREK